MLFPLFLSLLFLSDAFVGLTRGDHLLPLTKCAQDTTFRIFTCDKAIDGDTNQNNNGGKKCSHTARNPLGGWWSAETTKPAFINYIKIYSRTDFISDRLTDFDILVDDVICASYKSDVEFSSQTFPCGKVGKHIRIVSRKENLTLCEVQAYGTYFKGDLLPLSNCDQDSVFNSYVCDKAIDGDVTSDIVRGDSCFLSGGQKNGWWSAEMAKPAAIKYIYIYGRTDYTTGSLTDFDILVDGIRCTTYKSAIERPIYKFKCERSGKEIKIVSRKKELTLCEVQVFGEYLPGDLLSLVNCGQDSAFNSYFCDKAIDGDTNQDFYLGESCFQSSAQYDGWLSAETPRPAFITYIYVYGRTDIISDALTDFDILLDGIACATYKSTTIRSFLKFKCERVGKQIKVISRKKDLTLCEVQAYGSYQNGDLLPLSNCAEDSAYNSYFCDKAIDGNINPDIVSGESCFHSNGRHDGWWSAETSRPALINFVYIYPRSDIVANTLTDFDVYVNGYLCGTYKSTIERTIYRIKCGHIGQRLKILSRKKDLTLCEVQVYGEYDNRAQRASNNQD